MLDLQAHHFSLELTRHRIRELQREARIARLGRRPRSAPAWLPALVAALRPQRSQQPACCSA